MMTILLFGLTTLQPFRICCSTHLSPITLLNERGGHSWETLWDRGITCFLAGRAALQATPASLQLLKRWLTLQVQGQGENWDFFKFMAKHNACELCAFRISRLGICLPSKYWSLLTKVADWINCFSPTVKI